MALSSALVTKPQMSAASTKAITSAAQAVKKVTPTVTTPVKNVVASTPSYSAPAYSAPKVATPTYTAPKSVFATTPAMSYSTPYRAPAYSAPSYVAPKSIFATKPSFAMQRLHASARRLCRRFTAHRCRARPFRLVCRRRRSRGRHGRLQRSSSQRVGSTRSTTPGTTPVSTSTSRGTRPGMTTGSSDTTPREAFPKASGTGIARCDR
jgi:hypothetical protein